MDDIELDDDDDDLFAVSLDDPLFDDLGSDGSEYGTIERQAYEDDRYGYG